MTETILFIMNHLFTIITIVILHILGPLSALHAIMNSHSSQGAIAWAMALTIFPYVSLPAYWIFGQNRFLQYIEARKSGDKNLYDLAAKVESVVAPKKVSSRDKLSPLEAAEKLGKIPILAGNEVTLLINGEVTYQSILEGIARAHSYILFQFYIINDDSIGRRFQELLIKKAREGVTVYFLYDKVGSSRITKQFLREMRDAGIHCTNFHAQKGAKNRFRINFRNHRKIVIVDGEICWVGGHNIGDEYVGKGPLGFWRDTHIRLRGAAILPCQLSFIEDWHWATNDILELPWEVPAASSTMPVLIMSTGPADTLATASLMFAQAINSAETSIWIASPYFVPDDTVMSSLQLAGLRGVDVRIIIPDNPDHILVFLAAYSFFEDATMAGVKFYRYTKGFMHQKAMLIDGEIAGIGTANMDNRSFRLNFEITAFVCDTVFAKQVKAMFEEDFRNARLMKESEFRDCSFWFKLKVRIAHLFSPVL